MLAADPKNQTVDYSKNVMPNSESPYVPPTQAVNNTDDNSQPDNNSKNISDPIINVTSANITIESKRGSNSFKKFVILGIIVILLVYAGVAYLYYKNEGLKNLIANLPTKNTAPIVTPAFNSTDIVIQNGNIIYKTGGDTTVIINKADYPTTGITGFAKVIVSPDQQMLCFESLAPAPKPALYISDINGNNSKLISINKSSCLWAKDSKTIVYQGKGSGHPNTDIYIYNLPSGVERNLTENTLLGKNPDFTLVGFSSDESALICSYVVDVDKNSQCQIDVQTGSFSSL